MATVKIEFDDRQLRKGISKFNRDLDRNIDMIVDRNALYATGWLKTNAPWTDRTGAARSGLTAIPLNKGHIHEIFMSYSVYYGIWLEVANSGKYTILIPGLRVIGNKLMRDLDGLIDRMNNT